MYSSVRNLLTGLIDYAGLFPPASLDFSTALDNFETYRNGEFGWMLGRFILPASRLAQLERTSIPLSVLAGADLDADLKRIQDFQHRWPEAIQSIELKGPSVADIREASEKIPSELPTFFEIPVGVGAALLIPAIAEQAGCAKIRTGGIAADDFPAPSEFARLLQLCAVFGVPFKATAGLHHPLRGSHPLTSDEHGACAVMHGFLNLFLAAGFIRNHIGPPLLRELIEEHSAGAFQFSEDGVKWKGYLLTSEEIANTRSQFAVSFGSCSFEEPVHDLQAIGLLG